MAVKGTEKELLTDGIDVDKQSKGPFIQNMDRHLNWKVRKGFGQAAQFDSTLGLNNVEYRQHLGSHYIKSNFGHEQIVTVIAARVYTGNFIKTNFRTAPIVITDWKAAGSSGMYLTAYLLSIYDITTDELYEELLHNKTEDSSRMIPLQHGLYETNDDVNYETYIRAQEGRQLFFEEVNDTLYFGDARLGCWAYIPTTIRKLNSKQVHAECGFDWANWDSESSIVRKMVPNDGDYAERYVYLTKSEFPKPNDITSVFGRIVYVDDKTLWFSDVGKPGSVLADNYVVIPSENAITAIEELAGNILIFTESETFFYRITEGGLLLSGGTLQNVSNHIGCLNPNSLVKAEGSVLWADDDGVYSTNNGLAVNKISIGIEKLWLDNISNPLTQYYQALGLIDAADLANENTSILFKFDSKNVHIEFDHIRKSLIFAIPQQDFAMILNSDGWSVWNFESMAAASGTIKATKNIKKPFFVMGDEALYMVGSSEAYTISDDSKFTQPATDADMNEDWTTNSYYILEYGRGGALDRSVQWSKSEDRRLINGKYYKMSPDDGSYIPTDANKNVVLVDPWVPVDAGYQLNNTIVPPATPSSSDFVTTAGDIFLLPFSIVPAEPYAFGGTFPKLPNKLIIQFFFDNNLWVPVFQGTTGGAESKPCISFPAERLPSAAGWTVVCRDGAGGGASATGNFIDLQYDGATATHTIQPYMNLNQYSRNRLFYIAMKAKHSTSQASTSMGLEGYRLQIINDEDTGDTYTTEAHFRPWQGSFIDNKLSDTGRHGTTTAGSPPANNPALPVDWVYKTIQVGLDDAAQSKARSLWLRIKSRGKGEEKTIANPEFGLLNAILASDWKDWTSQFVDYQGTAGLNKDIQDLQDGTSIRARMYDSVTSAMHDRTFNNKATWGDASDTSDGNYLIDDEEYDTINMSTSVKGEYFSWMLFGHMNNSAENLEISSIKATLRPAGGRRRKGRG